MKEKKDQKRSMERFALDLPSLISINGKEIPLGLRTDNISAGGAYFRTPNPLPAGTKVSLNLGLNGLKKSGAAIIIEGNVVRAEKEGMAILFEDYRIVPVCKKGAVVHIIGPNRLQNSLLMWFLEKNAGAQCKCESDICLHAFADKQQMRKHLVLWDCMGGEHYLLPNIRNLPQCFFALFNADPDKKLKKDILNQELRGVFYHHDPPEIFPKGISSMLDGQLWDPRKVLPKYAEPKDSDLSESIIRVTMREKMLLAELASGKRNKEIADKLCISKHTVRTHLQNIYRKLGVSDRFQAVLWAAKYLPF